MSLSFTGSLQQLTYEKVSDYLSASGLFKDALQAGLNQPQFTLTYGSALVSVEVLPWPVNPWDTSELVIVKASSCVTLGSRIGAELMRYLLQENSRMRFGSFYLSEPDQIWFAHSILGGDSMDLLELQTAILSVVTIADTYDDLIVAQFGGQRGLDCLL